MAASKNGTAMKGKQAMVTVYVEPEKLEHLRSLSDKTRISQAAYWREALDDLLAKHGRKAAKAATK